VLFLVYCAFSGGVLLVCSVSLGASNGYPTVAAFLLMGNSAVACNTSHCNDETGTRF